MFVHVIAVRSQTQEEEDFRHPRTQKRQGHGLHVSEHKSVEKFCPTTPARMYRPKAIHILRTMKYMIVYVFYFVYVVFLRESTEVEATVSIFTWRFTSWILFFFFTLNI